MQKLTILINLYALIRVCGWTSHDLYAFIGGISLLLYFLYILWANNKKLDIDL